MEYVLVIHEAEEGGYWAEFPALPGCFTQGETIDEVIKRAPEAVESHVEALKADGQDIPSERLLVMTLRLPEPSAA